MLAGFLGYTFASPVDVVQYTIRAHPTAGTRAPRSWTVEWSDDGVNWTAQETRESTGWANGELRTFLMSAPANAKARASQFAVEVLRINTGTRIRTSQLAVEVLRPNLPDAIDAPNARPQVAFCM